MINTNALKILLIITFFTVTTVGCKEKNDEATPEPTRSTEEFLEINGDRIPFENIISKEVFRAQGSYSLTVRLPDSDHMMFTHSESNYNEGNHLLSRVVTDTTVNINTYLKRGLKYHQFTTSGFYSKSQYRMYKVDGAFVSEFKDLVMYCALHETPPDSSIVMNGRLVWRFKD